MTRRKPQSTKQRKAQLQIQRAVKRGDIPPPPKPAAQQKRASHAAKRGLANVNSGSGVETKMLESRFMNRLDRTWLENARNVASNTVLVRPIPTSATILDASGLSGPNGKDLAAPRRPKWRYDQTKAEVEKNEEGIFTRWLGDTDAIIEKWRTPEHNGSEANKRSPTYFERNLQVWRQLWRVTEISQILLVLLDSRAPALHFPPSLKRYLDMIRPSPQLILVLTKVDLVGPERAAAWERYLSLQHPGARILQIESYKERAGFNDGRGGRHYFDPHIPPNFLQQLVDALKNAHTQLLAIPSSVSSDPEKLKNWRPRVKPSVNWDVLLDMPGSPENLPKANEGPTDAEHDGEVEVNLRYVTIGLIGQPNVGKSSLLNALFGAHRVRASRTPGKTKHFQTLFWTPEIRLVDCPGLVFPSLVPMEMQVLAGILPISQIASIASCVQFIAERMPLETIFGLQHPEKRGQGIEDKRTWRMGMEPSSHDTRGIIWTPMDIMTAYANAKGWVTAKASREDVNRAGNAILRMCADGRYVHWGFWPPDTLTNVAEATTDIGIWIKDAKEVSGGWEDGENDSESSETTEEGLEKGTESEDEAQSSGEGEIMVAGGRFGALALMDDSDTNGT